MPVCGFGSKKAFGGGGDAVVNELALFAGAGGGLLATHHLLGWRCIGYVEMAEYPCRILEARINDGLLSRAPIYHMHTRDFIRSGIAASYRGLVDVITAGFPCQPFSGAGLQLGGEDERKGWPDTIAIIRIVQPRYVFLENVPTLISSGYFGQVLGDLASSGYDCSWDCIPASAVGANHQRDRVWIVANAQSLGRDDRSVTASREDHKVWGAQEQTRGCCVIEQMANANGQRQSQPQRGFANKRGWIGDGSQEMAHPNGNRCNEVEQQDSRGANREGELSAFAQPGSTGEWWQVEPDVGRVVDGVAFRVDRLKALGNGQVPAVVAAAWRLLT